MVVKATEIVIVGGGSAGWLTACILAADHAGSVRITLVESSNIPTIGVGEGTWPSMRATLQRIGISETDFLIDCDASFKQGSCFRGWRTDQSNDEYYHPFSLPVGYQELDIAKHWLPFQQQVSFGNAVCAQGRVCDLGLAPKTISTPEYGFALNYAYHLDAGKFAELLKRHAIESLGIRHVVDDVVSIQGSQDGPIKAVITANNGAISADLFVDCSGFSGVLLDKHYQVAFVSQKQCLMNDSAIAIQVPYEKDDSPIASATYSTAQLHGWIWDIGLQTRRGTGYVYSSEHVDHDIAEQCLREYLSQQVGQKVAEQLPSRRIPIQPGFRERFWVHNCVAVGLSAGFIEPLEASAIALIEASAKFISDQLPNQPALMPIIAKRFNNRMRYHWEKIIDFLKLHYVLSQRTDSEYWLAARDLSTCSEWLADSMQLWSERSPDIYDMPKAMEMFPAASFQYIWYGMKAEKHVDFVDSPEVAKADGLFQQVALQTGKLVKALPKNRELLAQIRQHGLSRI